MCFRPLLWSDNLTGDICNWVVGGDPQSPPQVYVGGNYQKPIYTLVNTTRIIDSSQCFHHRGMRGTRLSPWLRFSDFCQNFKQFLSKSFSPVESVTKNSDHHVNGLLFLTYHPNGQVPGTPLTSEASPHPAGGQWPG